MPGGNVININDMIGKAIWRPRHQTQGQSHGRSLFSPRRRSDKLIDQDEMTREAIDLAENNGIVFFG